MRASFRFDLEDQTLLDISFFVQLVHILTWAVGYFFPNKDQKVTDARFYATKALYFACLAVTQLQLLRNYPFLPAILGGGNTYVWRDLTYRADMDAVTIASFRRMFIMEICYHAWSSFNSMLPGNRTKIEMLVHHIVTLVLMIVSWHYDHIPEGSIVLFIHNVPDIFTSTSKGLHAAGHLLPTFVSYLFMMASWVVFRLYLLSMFAYSVVTRPGLPVMVYAGSLLWVLEGLHIYWFYLFLQMGAKFLGSGGKTLPQDTSKKNLTTLDVVQEEDKIKKPRRRQVK